MRNEGRRKKQNKGKEETEEGRINNSKYSMKQIGNKQRNKDENKKCRKKETRDKNNKQ